jgi:hypothetical protein
VPINYFAVGTPTGEGGAHVPAYSIALCTLMCRFATNALARGGCPCAHALCMLLIFSVLLPLKRSALTGNKLVSALVPRPPSYLSLLNIPFPLRGGEVERENALQLFRTV